VLKLVSCNWNILGMRLSLNDSKKIGISVGVISKLFKNININMGPVTIQTSTKTLVIFVNPFHCYMQQKKKLKGHTSTFIFFMFYILIPAYKKNISEPSFINGNKLNTLRENQRYNDRIEQRLASSPRVH